MSDLERSQSRTPRRVREQRAYRYAVTGATAGVVAVVGLILAIVGVLGSTLWLVAAVVAAICGVLFWRTVSK
jgi:putative flippase GtrA